MLKYLVYLSLILSFTAAAETSNNESLKSTFSLEHYMGFYTDVESESRAYLSISKSINKETRFELLQGLTKLYTVNPGEQEVLFADTLMYLHFKLHQNLGLRLSASVPLSEQSQESGKVSTLSARISFHGKFLNDKLYLGYRPYASYGINKYTADKAGNPMTKFSIGNSVLVSLSPFDKFDLGAVLAAGINLKEKSIFEVNEDTSDSGFYSIDLYAAYAFNETFALRTGYSQGDSQLREGTREMYFYDQYNSLYYLGTDISF